MSDRKELFDDSSSSSSSSSSSESSSSDSSDCEEFETTSNPMQTKPMPIPSTSSAITQPQTPVPTRVTSAPNKSKSSKKRVHACEKPISSSSPPSKKPRKQNDHVEKNTRKSKTEKKSDEKARKEKRRSEKHKSDKTKIKSMDAQIRKIEEKKDKKKEKTTASDLFGGDDEDVKIDGMEEGLYSYISRRLANGYAKQLNPVKSGSHYIELKVYNSEEVEKVQPCNRWRHHAIVVKNRSDTNTEAWGLLSQYIAAVRKEFTDCPVSYRSSYYS